MTWKKWRRRRFSWTHKMHVKLWWICISLNCFMTKWKPKAASHYCFFVFHLLKITALLSEFIMLKSLEWTDYRLAHQSCPFFVSRMKKKTHFLKYFVIVVCRHWPDGKFPRCFSFAFDYRLKLLLWCTINKISFEI